MLIPAAVAGLLLVGVCGGTATFADADAETETERKDATVNEPGSWPFNDTSGTLRCHPDGGATFTADRVVRTTAQTSVDLASPRVEHLDRYTDTVRQVDVRDAVENGQRLCDERRR